jgi:hypothetical protein
MVNPWFKLPKGSSDVQLSPKSKRIVVLSQSSVVLMGCAQPLLMAAFNRLARLQFQAL